MKSNKNTEHTDSPTRSLRKLSRPRFIITVILTAVISLSLVVGGTMTFFGMGSSYFITVNGKEVLTPDIVEAVRSQLSQPGISEQQKLSQLMQALTPREQSLMWIHYGARGGIDFKPADLYEALKASYDAQKLAYQEEFKSYFTLPYADFVKNNLDTINLQATVKAVMGPDVLDDYNITQEYVAQNTSSTVEYRYTDLNSYLINMQRDSIAEFYDKGSQQVISGKTLLVLPFSSDDEAIQESSNLEKNPKLIEEHFSKVTQTVTIKKDSDADTYLYVQDVPIGNVVAFTYRRKSYVGKVTADHHVPFDKLDSEEKQNIAKEYAKSLKKSEVREIRSQIRKELEENAKQPYILMGATYPIALTNASNIRDSRTSMILPFATSENKQLFPYLFSDNGSQSPILEYNDIYYSVRVIKKRDPVFPMPSSARTQIQASIKQREDMVWSQYYRQQIQEKTKVKVNTKALREIIQ